MYVSSLKKWQLWPHVWAKSFLLIVYLNSFSEFTGFQHRTFFILFFLQKLQKQTTKPMLLNVLTKSTPQLCKAKSAWRKSLVKSALLPVMLVWPRALLSSKLKNIHRRVYTGVFVSKTDEIMSWRHSVNLRFLHRYQLFHCP